MRVIHLLDVYLPSTLSWVEQLLDSLESVEIGIAAPWIVQNRFYNPKFRYFTFPPQRWLFPKPENEFAFPFWQRLFTAAQRRVPLYPFFLGGQIKNDRPDLLHAHFGPTGCLYLPLAKKLKIPLVVTFYGFDYAKLPNLRPVFKEKYRELFAGATKVIAASEIGCEELHRMGCPSAKLAVVPPSPNLQRFPFKSRLKESGSLNLVQVATFTHKKGHKTTLEAFRLALRDCPNMHLVLAGESQNGDLVRDLFEQSHSLGLDDRVVFKNFVKHHRMADFLAGFDVFIHPSCHAPDGDHEATPVILLEAQATGLPVIATDHFDLPLEVIHGRTGLLAPENDPVALAGHIRRFYWMENAEYQMFSHNARQHVEAGFDVKKAAFRLRKVYEEILNDLS